MTNATPESVHTPYRRVTTPNRVIDDLDMDIRVQNHGGSSFEFEVVFWNLARDTWQGLLTDATLNIDLGWVDGPISRVCSGVIDSTSITDDGADTAYRVSGRDTTSQRVQQRLSGTWSNVSLSRLTAELATACDLQTGLLPSGGDDITFDHWTISPERRVSYWLDQLCAVAERRTDTEWEWYGEGGALSLTPRRQSAADIIELARDSSLLVFEPEASDQANTNPSAPTNAPADAGGFAREFIAYLEPYIGRDRRVRVEAPDVDRDAPLYRVTRYTFTSGTTEGVHHVSGEMVPQSVTESGGAA